MKILSPGLIWEIILVKRLLTSKFAHCKSEEYPQTLAFNIRCSISNCIRNSIIVIIL